MKTIRDRDRSVRKEKGIGEVKDIIFMVGGKWGRRSITLLKDSRASPFRPSDKSGRKMKTMEWREIVALNKGSPNLYLLVLRTFKR
jgi:hypothetical protein